MHYGVAIFPTESGMAPDELGRALEERGFESLWVAEHTHIPAERRSPYPGGGELPRQYYETLDPFVALTAAATATTRLKVATGICLVVERDPIITAKEVASLDVVSDGRFLFGVGGGWNAEEMENHGTPFERRWKVMRERIEAMQAIWSHEPAEYHGEFVDFDPIHQLPKPRQTPRPPIHVGGGRGGARRAARYGDGWLPIAGRDELDDPAAVLAEEAARVGRDPAELEISIYFAPQDAAALGRLAEGGVHRAVFGLPPDPAERQLPRLDRLAALIDEVG
ncbi:MAG: LLM class F420-dependent oxidoreductase [Actinomyces sp.]|nr:MAG: LLM class F420-dependent oxidoreductase [Actinomyces sp.]